MKTENLHILIGAGVVAVSLVLAIFWISSDHVTALEDGYRLTATFSKTDGVGIGSEVLLAGIPVGLVIDEAMDVENYQVTLTLKMDDGIELPVDSGAEITSDGIFGAKYISINVGGEFDVLEDGDAFEFIRDSVIFEEIFERVIQMGEAGQQKRKQADTEATQEDSSGNILLANPSISGADSETSQDGIFSNEGLED